MVNTNPPPIVVRRDAPRLPGNVVRFGTRSLCHTILVGLLFVCFRPQDAAPQEVGSDSIIRFPIRFHLLTSTERHAVSTTWTEEDVRTLLRVVNEVWSRAGIEWTFESIVREVAPHAARFDSLLAGLLLPTGERQRSIVPRESLLDPAGWDVFLIRDYGQIAGGVFWPEIPAIVLAQRGMGTELDPAGVGGLTLAHELVHSLGLQHEECDPSAPNIMANKCGQPNAPRILTAE